MAVTATPLERAWREGEQATVSLMGTINVATAALVRTIRTLIDNDGWTGHGIQSVEHWLTWKGGLSRGHADKLTRIARRIDDLPTCWALFEAGRVTEDAMSLIARKVPAARDAEVASLAPGMLVSQLQRTLASCPEAPDRAPRDDRRASRQQRYLRLREDADGWGRGEFSLPPDEMATLRMGLVTARDAEFRDRRALEPDADLDQPGLAHRPGVSWADGLVRMAAEATDALDPTLPRTGRRGERTKVILHHDIDHTGSLGPGQLHLGPVLPDTLARFLSCDAEVVVAAYQAGRLLGIHPTERTVNRATRRAIEHRDQGCAHPLCTQQRWLHIHHIVHWAHQGLTIPSNLLCLCAAHHRQIHTGELRIEGNPEAGTLRFFDARGHPIEPPDPGPPPRLPGPDHPSPFTPPYGERLDPRWFSWN